MKKGFTLIEIMIVVAIIAILAAVAIPNFIAYRQTSQQNACKANINTIANACEAFEVKKGTQTSIALSDLTDASSGAAFLKEPPKCPYDNTKSYTITKDSDTQRWVVTCQAHDDAKHNVNASSTGD